MQFRSPAGTPWTAIIVRRHGRTQLRLWVPTRPRVIASWAAAAALALTVFAGWHLHGRFGSVGAHSLQLDTGSGLASHWVPFEETAAANGDSGGRSALVHALQLGLGDRMAAVQLWAGKIAPKWSEAAEASAEEGSDGTLLWPVSNGHHVRGYGSGRNAYHLAIDIAGPRGSDVLAAASGIVGYVGNQMRGYGNLLILVHAGGRATFYAHNQRILVVPGERVARGQPVAVLGSTGNSLGPHVHFELVYNERNCDPAPLFRTASHGSALGVAPATWAADGPKPRAVRCAKRRKHPVAEENAPEVAQNAFTREPLATLESHNGRFQHAL